MLPQQFGLVAAVMGEGTESPLGVRPPLRCTRSVNNGGSDCVASMGTVTPEVYFRPSISLVFKLAQLQRRAAHAVPAQDDAHVPKPSSKTAAPAPLWKCRANILRSRIPEDPSMRPSTANACPIAEIGKGQWLQTLASLCDDSTACLTGPVVV